jgi:hypothetical protein
MALVFKFNENFLGLRILLHLTGKSVPSWNVRSERVRYSKIVGLYVDQSQFLHLFPIIFTPVYLHKRRSRQFFTSSSRRLGLVVLKLMGSCFGRGIKKFIFRTSATCRLTFFSLGFLSIEAALLLALKLLSQHVDNKELVELFCWSDI